MATQDQVVSVSLQKGLETKTDLKQGINGRLLLLENATFQGVTDIEKRNGYTAVPSSVLQVTSGLPSNITAGNSLATYNNTLVMTDSSTLYNYSANEANWVDDGVKIAVNTSTLSLSDEIQPYFWPLEATDGTVKFVITPEQISGTNTDSITFTYFDYVSNVLLATGVYTLPTANGAPLAMKIMHFSTYFLLLVTNLDSGGVNYQTILYSFQTTPANNPTVTTVATYISTVNGSGTDPQIQIVAPAIVKSATHVYVANADPTHAVNIYAYDTTLTLTSSVLAVSNVTGKMDMFYDAVNSEILIAYSVNSGPNTIVLQRYTAALTSIATIATITNANVNLFCQITFASNGTDIGLWYEVNRATLLANSTLETCFINYILISAYRTTPVVSSPVAYGYQHYLYSKAIYLNGNFTVALIYSGIVQNFAGPLEAQTGIYVIAQVGLQMTVIARVAYDFTYLYTTQGTTVLLSGLVQWMNLELPFLYAAQTQIIAGAILPVYTAQSVKLTLGGKERNLQLADNLNLSSAQPILYDGQGVAEIGFNNYPECVNITWQVGTDPTGAGGTYQYTAIYTWYDAQGNYHRSAPSIPRAVTTTSDIGSGISPTHDTKGIVSFGGLGLSEAYKAINVQLQIYRTVANGTVFFLNGTVSNSAISPIGTNFDITPDSTLVQGTQLYTTGGEVDNIPPSSFHLMTSFKNRIIAIDDENPYVWWYSKQDIQGYPIEFSDSFTQNIDQKGGPISAVSTMDDKLIFFKTSNVWYVTGDGPAPNGTNNDFIYPQLISSDTGCVNQDSIILTPRGLLFQSPKGIYMLDRGLGMSYIGAPVEAYNQYTITSVQMIANTNQVRFTLSGTDTAIVYDYLVDQWSVFRNIMAIDSTIYQGNFAYLQSNGIIQVETPGSYLDNGVVVPMNFTTGWFKLSDIQGFERFKKMLIIGTSSGLSTIGISFNYDYNTSNLVNIQPIPVSANLNRMQYRIFPPRQKCEAFQLVYVETPVASSAGVTQISNLALEIGMKKGPFKMPAAQSFG